MTMKSLAALAVLSLALASAATPASAQKRSLADRVAALEAQQSSEGNAAGQQNIEMVNRLTQLQSEVQALRAQVESLQNENEQLKQRGKDQYLDLDTRLQRVEGTGGAASSPSPAALPPPVRGSAGAPLNAPRPASGPDGEAAYAAAFQSLKNENFVESARAFQAYLRDYPDGSLAPNAWYWLGESYYVTQNYPLALQAFDTVVTRFPDSNKAPDALLKKGFTQLELGQTGPGSATLNAVVNQFPDSEAARMATTRLRILAH